MERSTAVRKKDAPTVTIVWVYCTLGSLLPKEVDVLKVIIIITKHLPNPDVVAHLLPI